MSGRPTQIRISALDCRHEFLTDGAWMAVALLGERVVGAIHVRDEGEWAWIQTVFVDGTCRRAGIGEKLLAFARENLHAIAPRAIGMAAGIFDSNTPSRRLFEKAGFVYVYQWPSAGHTACLYSWRAPDG